MDESILLSIKKLLGLPSEYTAFDQDIMIHINSVFLILEQIGVNSVKGYSIKTGTEPWSDVIKNADTIEAIKSYVYLKVRMLFDPPQSSAVKEANKQMIDELEWRINFQTELNKGVL